MNTVPRDVQVSGKRLRVWNGGTGPALLLLHSAYGDAELSWEPVWDELGASFTVIAPDLPGFGASEPLEQPSLAAMAKAIKELLDVQKVDRAIIVGNSFGAAIAIEFALSYPERALCIVLVNGGYMPVLPRFVKKLVSMPAVEKHARAFAKNMVYSNKAFEKAFARPAKLPPLFFDRIRKNEEKQARLVFDAFMLQTEPQRRPTMPITMIWGTEDNLLTMDKAKTIRNWLGKPDFMAIDGAGHMPQIEQPRRFVEIMRKIGKKSGIPSGFSSRAR
jgi:pimeloyl-ACP methyl ester carboxylesterase